MLRMFTAGESHGPELSTIIEGFPAGISLSPEDLNRDLARRQCGYGRGDRMKIETDRVVITAGVRHGETLGGPVCLKVINRDFENWTKIMSVEATDKTEDRAIYRPRPGHADLAGHLKYAREDMRDILERSSARETTMRVAAGALARIFLRAFGVEIQSHVLRIGKVQADCRDLSFDEIRTRAEASDVRCADPKAAEAMRREIDEAIEKGDTRGGIVEILIRGCVPGLGSHVQWDRKLDGRLAQAIVSCQAVKAVEFGLGFGLAERPGSEVQDEIFWEDGFYARHENNMGGLEGGMTNGEMIVIRVAKKPISTLRSPLMSVDTRTKQPMQAGYERSDVTAVPAEGVIAECNVAFVLADAHLEKFGGDSLAETIRNWQGYRKQIGLPENHRPPEHFPRA